MIRVFNKRIAEILIFFLIITSIFVSAPISFADTSAQITSSEVSVWFGNDQIIDKTTTGNADTPIYTDSNEEYAVYGICNDDGVLNGIMVRPLDSDNDGKVTIPAIRANGSLEVIVYASTDWHAGTGKTIAEARIQLTLDKFSDAGQPWDGYSFYFDFDEEKSPSAKTKFALEDGARRDGESSTVKINGTIKTTSACIDDCGTVDFGSKDEPLENAIELSYQQSIDPNEEGFSEDYFSVEVQGTKVNAYVTGAALAGGSYLAGWETVDQNFYLLDMRGDGEFNVDDQDAKTAPLQVTNMKVFTGGKINVVSNDTIKNIPNGQAAYYTQKGTIYQITKEDGKRMHEYASIVDNCALGDHSNVEGRYEYIISNNGKEMTFASKARELWNLEMPSIEHGHFEIEAGTGLAYYDPEEERVTGYQFEQGTEVKFTLVPDAGYQYKPGTFGFLGQKVEDNSYVHKTDDPGVYYYYMEDHNTGVECEFEEVKDACDVQSEDVNSANINMAGNNDYSGNMELSVEDATNVDAETAEQIENLAGDKSVKSLELSLNNVIETVSGEDPWITPVHELDEEMSVSLTLTETIAAGSDFEIVRVHEGEAEVIPSTFNSKTGTITFDTDKYSTYAIAYKKAPADLRVGDSKVTLYAGTKVNTYSIKATYDFEAMTSGVKYKSSNAKVAKVSTSGKITALKTGTAKITVSAKGKTKTITVTVKNPTITAPSKATVKKGKTASLSIKLNPSKAGVSLVKMSSKDKKIAKVTLKNNNLTIKGLKAGKIKVKLQSGKTIKTISVTVK